MFGTFDVLQDCGYGMSHEIEMKIYKIIFFPYFLFYIKSTMNYNETQN